MSLSSFQIAAQYLLCACATMLYAHKLPKRDDYSMRLCAVLVAGAVCAAANALGYSLFPPLTDDLSFFSAVGMFALVVAVITGFVCVTREVSAWAALFCASSGYLVHSIVFGLDRVLHLSGIVRGVMGDAELLAATAPMGDVVSMAVSAAVVLLAVHLFLTKRLERSGLLGIRNPLMFFAVFVAVAVSLIFDLAIKDIGAYEVPMRYPMVLSVIYLVICVFILIAEFEIIYNLRLEADVATMERTMAEQERQFDLSRRTIDAINRRVHDIRHHVASLLAEGEGGAAGKETLAQVVREIDVYDAAVRTGNAALDVVLTEKGLLCRRAGITFSCIADGDALAFMGPADLYALLGTALDDAIQAVREVPDGERRSISLNVRSQMGMAAIGIQNYRTGELRIVDGIPVGGGVSLDTILSVAERYDGTVTYSMVGDTLSFDALIPMS